MKDEAFVTSVMSKMSFQIDFLGSCLFGLGTAFGGLFLCLLGLIAMRVASIPKESSLLCYKKYQKNSFCNCKDKSPQKRTKFAGYMSF